MGGCPIYDKLAFVRRFSYGKYGSSRIVLGSVAYKWRHAQRDQCFATTNGEALQVRLVVTCVSSERKLVVTT